MSPVSYAGMYSHRLGSPPHRGRRRTDRMRMERPDEGACRAARSERQGRRHHRGQPGASAELSPKVSLWRVPTSSSPVASWRTARSAAKEIEAATGRRALPVGCHVGRWEDADMLLDTVYDAFGRCDVLVNNAGHVAGLRRSGVGEPGAVRQGARRQCPRAVPAERPLRQLGWPKPTVARSSTSPRPARCVPIPPTFPTPWPRPD